MKKSELPKLLDLCKKLEELGEEPMLLLTRAVAEKRKDNYHTPIKACYSCANQNECTLKALATELARGTRSTHKVKNNRELHSELSTMVAEHCESHSTIQDKHISG